MIGISISSAPMIPYAALHTPRHESGSGPVNLSEIKPTAQSARPIGSQVGPKAQQGALLEGGNILQVQAAEGEKSSAAKAAADPPPKPGELTEAEDKLVKELKTADKETRQHEEAHARAGGAYAGAPKYEFQRGPDGGQYAVGGSVSIDVSPVTGDPEATIRKMEVVRRAASAPAEPSGADRAVMAQANATAQAARAEQARESREEQQAIHDRPEDEDGNAKGASLGTGFNTDDGSFANSDFTRSSQAYQSAAALLPA